MIVARSITKRFGRRVALDAVSLRVEPGERALLVGPNGAGKTTLLRILTGFVDPDGGTAEVAGLDLSTSRQAAAARTGYLPEGAPLPPEMRVASYLRWRARLKGVRRSDSVAFADEAMAATGLREVERQRIGTLSRGFRQRVGLADAMVARPEVLVLDEPTVGLDPVQVRELGAVLDGMSGKRTVLVSTHALADAVAAAASRIVVLVGGRVAAAGTPEEVRATVGAATLEAAVVALASGGDAGGAP